MCTFLDCPGTSKWSHNPLPPLLWEVVAPSFLARAVGATLIRSQKRRILNVPGAQKEPKMELGILSHPSAWTPEVQVLERRLELHQQCPNMSNSSPERATLRPGLEGARPMSRAWRNHGPDPGLSSWVLAGAWPSVGRTWLCSHLFIDVVLPGVGGVEGGEGWGGGFGAGTLGIS